MSLSNKFLNPKIEWLFHQEKIHWDHISLTDSHQNFQHRATLSRFLFRRCRGWRQGHSMTCAAHWVQLGVINGYNYGTNLHKLGYNHCNYGYILQSGGSHFSFTHEYYSCKYYKTYFTVGVLFTNLAVSFGAPLCKSSGFQYDLDNPQVVWAVS